MRIVTRPDFDGVVCAVLLKDVLPIDQPIKWVEPSDMQKQLVEVVSGDVIANLPYSSSCSLWFDHHYSNRPTHDFKGSFQLAPSAARVIFDYYGGRFQKDYTELVSRADKIDAADLNKDEVAHPEKYPYILLSMTISGREDYDEAYWNRLVDFMGAARIDEVMADPVVSAKCANVLLQNARYKTLLEENTRVEGHVAISDFRNRDEIPAGNRFLGYCMFPQTVVHVKIRYDNKYDNKLVVSVGHSIFNRNCQVNVGKMLSRFEGGGHEKAGSCTFDAEKADDYIPRIIDILKENKAL
ncbi:MAG: exopolyphosphatase [Desulfobacterales bacterium]